MEEKENANEISLRKDFARVFGWPRDNPYSTGFDRKVQEPTWAEIFAEVGRLKAVGDISTLYDRVNKLEDNQSIDKINGGR